MNLWFGVALALAGTALLSLDFGEGFSVDWAKRSRSAARRCSQHNIIYVDTHARTRFDASVRHSVRGLLVLGGAGMLIFEAPTIAQVWDNAASILYVGAISGAVGYTFQLIGQKYADRHSPPSSCAWRACLLPWAAGSSRRGAQPPRIRRMRADARGMRACAASAQGGRQIREDHSLFYIDRSLYLTQR
jgi:hypothetical protein